MVKGKGPLLFGKVFPSVPPYSSASEGGHVPLIFTMVTKETSPSFGSRLPADKLEAHHRFAKESS